MALITITETIGSRGVEIASRVARELKVELYDDNRLHWRAMDIGTPFENLAGLEERAPGFFERLLTTKPRQYLDIMETVIYEVSSKGEGVIIGHAGQMLLRDFNCAFHVLVRAGNETRVANLVEQQGISPSTAEKLIRKVDDRQNGFMRYAFHLDRNDPSLYDLIISTEKLGIRTAAELIVFSSRSEDISTCSLSALEAMQRFSREKRIHAVLLEHDIDVSTLTIEVAEKGIAKISGFSRSLEEKEKIPGIVKRVEGVAEVRLQVAVQMASL